MNELQLINENGKIYVDSRQVAEMIGKRHADLMRSIDGYIEILGQNAKLRSDNFFVKSTYQAGNNKTYPCYKLTRKGCDMVANKLLKVLEKNAAQCYVHSAQNCTELTKTGFPNTFFKDI